MEEQNTIIELIDESGNTVKFDLVMTFDYEGKRYAALLPVDDVEGVGDDDGNLVPVSPAGIDALLEIWPVFEAFQAEYVARGLMLDQEKNASAPSPTGPSAGAAATARPARTPARTAPQD